MRADFRSIIKALPAARAITTVIPSLLALILFGPIIVRANQEKLSLIDGPHSSGYHESPRLSRSNSKAPFLVGWHVRPIHRIRKHLSESTFHIDAPNFKQNKHQHDYRAKRSQIIDTSLDIHSTKSLDRLPAMVNFSFSPATSISSIASSHGLERSEINHNKSGPVMSLNPLQATLDEGTDQPPVYMQRVTVILVVLHVAVFITGLVGNILVCLSVYRNKSLQTVTNYYIVNLAVADFLVILICLPPTVYWDLTLTWNFGLILCKLVLYLQSTSVSVSVLTLTCISIDRWYAICRPLQFSSTKYRVKISIALVWLVSMLIAAPDVVFLTTKPIYEENNYVYMDCIHSWPESNTRMYQLCIVTLLFVCPFVLMTISYAHIVNVLWRNETMAESLQHSIQLEEEQQQQHHYQYQNQQQHPSRKNLEQSMAVNESIPSSHEYPIKVIDDYCDKRTPRSIDEIRPGNRQRVGSRTEASFYEGHLCQSANFRNQTDQPDVATNTGTREEYQDISLGGRKEFHLSSVDDELIDSARKLISPRCNLESETSSRQETSIKTHEETRIEQENDGTFVLTTKVDSHHGSQNAFISIAGQIYADTSGHGGDKRDQISQNIGRELDEGGTLQATENFSELEYLGSGSNSRSNCCHETLDQNIDTCASSHHASVLRTPLCADSRALQDHNSECQVQAIEAHVTHPIELDTQKKSRVDEQPTETAIEVVSDACTPSADMFSNDLIGVSYIDETVHRDLDKICEQGPSVAKVNSDIPSNYKDILHLKKQRDAIVAQLNSVDIRHTIEKTYESMSQIDIERSISHQSSSKSINMIQGFENEGDRDTVNLPRYRAGIVDDREFVRRSHGTSLSLDCSQTGLPQQDQYTPNDQIDVDQGTSRSSNSPNGCCRWFLRSKPASVRRDTRPRDVMSTKMSKKYQKNLENYAARQTKYREWANTSVKNSKVKKESVFQDSKDKLTQPTTISVSHASPKKVILSPKNEDIHSLKPSKITNQYKSQTASVSSDSFRSLEQPKTINSEHRTGSKLLDRDQLGKELPVNKDVDLTISVSSYHNSSTQTRFNKLIESRKKAAKMLIVIVIMFGLCYLPIHFLNILRYTVGLPQNDITTIASLVSHWLCYFNSAINPLIYNLMSDDMELN